MKQVILLLQIESISYGSEAAAILFLDSISKKQTKNMKNICPLCTIMAMSVKQNKQKQ